MSCFLDTLGGGEGFDVTFDVSVGGDGDGAEVGQQLNVNVNVDTGHPDSDFGNQSDFANVNVVSGF